MTEAQKRALSQVLAATTGWLHHGDCVGADAEAHEIAREYGLWIMGHPPKIDTLRAYSRCDALTPPLDYLARNRVIIEMTEFLLAAEHAR